MEKSAKFILLFLRPLEMAWNETDNQIIYCHNILMIFVYITFG
jgi:hypothetical protein